LPFHAYTGADTPFTGSAKMKKRLISERWALIASLAEASGRLATSLLRHRAPSPFIAQFKFCCASSA